MSEFKKNLSFAWKYLKKEKGKIALSIVCNLIGILINIVIPILSAKIIIHLTTNKFHQLLFLSISLLILELFNNIRLYFVIYAHQTIYRNTLTYIQKDLGGNILKIENRILDQTSSGVFIERLTNDTSRMSEIFNTINRNLTRIITDVGIFIAILIINKIAFLYLVFMIFIYYFIERKRVCAKTENDKVIRKKSEKVSGFIGELVRGVRDLKMLNAEDSFTRQLADEVIDLNKARYLQGAKDRGYILIRDSFLNFSDTGMIFLLVFLISSHQLEPTNGLVIYNYMGKLTSIVSCFSTLLEKVKDFNLSASRIFSIMDDQVFRKEKFGDQKIEKVKGNFEFKEVTFSYQDHKKVLDQLSFKINCNTTTAFVGKSGAGKSTIFNLLCKMYDYDQGLITIDGVDIKQLDKDTIRGNITIISQNPYIFHMSIRKNLELVKSDMTEEEMKEACRIACLDEFINTLPDSYDTIVGEGGISLSGGQRQRLALARAFLQKTEIILFDEATSNLDNETQRKIQKAIENMKKEYTILIIAHRLSTIINSDKILFLNHGKIEQEGTHQELLLKNKNYKRLYESELIDRPKI